MSTPHLTWVLEGEVFADGDPLEAAARAAGHAVLAWSDDWWESGRFPHPEGPVLFHGSLGNAARIRRELPWTPGAFCATERFACDAWYERASRWLLHERFEILPVSQLVAGAEAGELEPPEPVYVLDLCESDGALHLLELNPLSGADPYGCDGPAVVEAIARHLSGD